MYITSGDRYLQCTFLYRKKIRPIGTKGVSVGNDKTIY